MQGSNALPNTDGVEAGIPVELDPTVSRSPEAAEVVAFQAAIESALVKGDVTFLQNAIADDFSMVHDESWIRGGRPRNVANKKTVLRSAGNRFYRFRQDDHVRIETHGESCNHLWPLSRLRLSESHDGIGRGSDIRVARACVRKISWSMGARITQNSVQ